MKIYNLSQEAIKLVWVIVVSHGVMMILVWISGYMLPVVFRRAEDLDAGNGKNARGNKMIDD